MRQLLFLAVLTAYATCLNAQVHSAFPTNYPCHSFAPASPGSNGGIIPIVIPQTNATVGCANPIIALRRAVITTAPNGITSGTFFNVPSNICVNTVQTYWINYSCDGFNFFPLRNVISNPGTSDCRVLYPTFANAAPGNLLYTTGERWITNGNSIQRTGTPWWHVEGGTILDASPSSVTVQWNSNPGLKRVWAEDPIRFAAINVSQNPPNRYPITQSATVPEIQIQAHSPATLRATALTAVLCSTGQNVVVEARFASGGLIAEGANWNPGSDFNLISGQGTNRCTLQLKAGVTQGLKSFSFTPNFPGGGCSPVTGNVWFGPPPAATGELSTNFSIPWDYLTGASNCTPIQFTYVGDNAYFTWAQSNPGSTTYNWSTFGQGTLTPAGTQYDGNNMTLGTSIPTVNYHPPSSPFGSQGAISVWMSNACGLPTVLHYIHYVPTSVPNEYAIPAFNNTGGCNRGAPPCPTIPCQPEEEFSVSPNPADGELTIALEELTNQPQAIAAEQAKAKDLQRTYQIFSTGGRLMRSGTMAGARDNVSLSGLPTGTYHLVLLENGKMVGRKTFVKQ